MASKQKKMVGKTNRTYHISYKHPEHGSDTIGCDFLYVIDAQMVIEVLKADPGLAGYADWLKDASLWVSDDKGNAC